jgi:hypothetical protein
MRQGAGCQALSHRMCRFEEQGEIPAQRIGEMPMQPPRRLPTAHQTETRQFDLFHPPAPEPRWPQFPEEAREMVMSLMAQMLSEHARHHREETAGGHHDD